MTPDEIQALREKHQLRMDPDFGDYCLPCSAGNEYPVSDYPCDVIKVLDAWEAENDYWTQIANGTLPEMEYVACIHHGVDVGGTDYYGTSNPPQETDWNYNYCPNCGEKLTKENN